MDITNFGKIKTIGELKEIIKDYDDNISFGFRNQPEQELCEIKTDDEIFIVFQEIIENGLNHYF